MTWWMILLIVLLFVILLLHLPVTFYATYNGEFSLKLRYLFIKLTLFPKKKKKKRKASSSEEKEGSSSEKKDSFGSNIKKILKNKGISGFIDLLKNAASEVVTLPRLIADRIIVKTLDINIVCAEEDAAETAISYGRICAGAYPAISVIASNLRCKKIDVDIYPDFDKTKTEIYANAVIKVPVISSLAFVIKALTKTVRAFKIIKTAVQESDTCAKN